MLRKLQQLFRYIVKINVSKRRFRVPDRLAEGCVPVKGAVHKAGHFLQRLAQAQAEAGQNLLHFLPGIGQLPVTVSVHRLCAVSHISRK